MASFIQNIWDCIVLVWILLYGFIDTIKFKYFEDHSPKDEENVNGKVIVVTGAQRGIGKAAATEFAKRGATVVIGCVDLKEGRQAMEEIKDKTGNKDIVLIHLDLSEMSSVRKFAMIVRERYPEIKILLNNAGIGGASNGNVKTKDGFNLHVAVNHLGHFLLTNLLIPNFRKGTRVIAMSSTLQLFSKLDLDDFMMDKADLEFGFENGIPYINSKFSNALFIKELGRRLEGTSITTYGVCPGIVRTALYKDSSTTLQFIIPMICHLFGFSPEEACIGVIYCALNKKIEKETGKMYRYKKDFNEANDRLDPIIARRLWELSSKLVKL